MVDLQSLERAFLTRYAAEAPRLALYRRQPNLEMGEKRHLLQVGHVAAKGLAARLARLGADSQEDLIDLVAEFVHYGPKAVLQTGSQRGGDFLNNQLRGQWAERVVLSMAVSGLAIVPFGPSGAAMPGEEDHREVVRTFREIHLFEGKRPDLLAFERETWAGFSKDHRDRACSWPKRLLEPADDAMVRQAACAIEVKNSTWHYGQRRKAGGGPLSITVKDEELEQLNDWEMKTGRPVMFFQVLFDEIYCMSYRRMKQAIARESIYRVGDYEKDEISGAGGKVFHRFHLDDFTHLCGLVVFPSESLGVVRVLPDGNVVPYIDYRPAHTTDVAASVIRREIAHR